jgi:AraC-like DNA-binding protein
MKYFEYKPQSVLKDYIDHIAFDSYGIEDENLSPCIVPDCMTELVLNFGKRYQRKTIKSDDFTTVEGSHIIGIKTQPHILLENAEMETISIRFKPSRLSFFTNVPMNEITDSAIKATDVFGADISCLEDRLQMAKDVQRKIEIIETFLYKRLFIDYKKVEAFEILSSMYENPNNTMLKETTLIRGMYYKKLERLFADSIGITPKLAERIIRINYAIGRKLMDNSLTFMELTYIAGYFDQSHFIKDFTKLSNKNPKDFFNNISSMDLVNFNSFARQFPIIKQ